MLSEIFNFIFSPLLGLGEVLSLTIISLIISLVIVVAYRFLMDQNEAKYIKDTMKKHQENAKKAQKEKNMEEANKYLGEIMKLNKKYLLLSLKPMLISMLMFFLVFPWVSETYKNFVFQLPFSLPLIGNGIGWLLWYVLIVILSSFIFRKILGVH